MKNLISYGEVDNVNPAQDAVEDCPQYRVIRIVAYGNCQCGSKGDSGCDEISLVDCHGNSPVFEFFDE